MKLGQIEVEDLTPDGVYEIVDSVCLGARYEVLFNDEPIALLLPKSDYSKLRPALNDNDVLSGMIDALVASVEMNADIESDEKDVIVDKIYDLEKSIYRAEHTYELDDRVYDLKLGD